MEERIECSVCKNGLTPYADYGDITPAQWEVFVRQKTTKEAVALSQKQTELAKSNIHKVHLGPGGYQRKIDQWRREREAAIAAGKPDPYDGLDDRGWQWFEARKPKIVQGKPKFDQPETEAVAERMLKLAELQKKGEFKPNREVDVLSTAIGSKEHGGRVRGMSSKLSIRDGFEKGRARYRSHDHYKEEIVAAAENAMQAKFQDLFMATLAEQ